MRNFISTLLVMVIVTTALCSSAIANTDRLAKKQSVSEETTSKASSSMKSGFWENLVNGVLSALHDVAINQGIKSDIVEAAHFLDKHDTYRALQVLEKTQRRLRRHNNHSYRKLSEQLGAICSDIRNGHVATARKRLRHVERRLKVSQQGHHNSGHHNTGGSYTNHNDHNNGHHNDHNNGHHNDHNNGHHNDHNNGHHNDHNNGHHNDHNNGYNNDYNNGHQTGTSWADANFYRSIDTSLRTSMHYLRINNGSAALNGIRQVDAALAQRYSNLDRQLRQTAISIQKDIRRHRLAYAISKLQGMQRQVRDAINSASSGYNPNPGHNPNPGYNPNPGHGHISHQEKKNRREWMRDIRDLIDTIQDNNIQMARRDLRRLVSDIRNDGNNSSFNRDLIRQVQFVGVSLNHGYPDTRNILRTLRQISRKIKTSLN